MTWLLILILIDGTVSGAQTLSVHATMTDCFEARDDMIWNRRVQPARLTCLRNDK